MSCCHSNIIPFNNAEITTVSYPQSFRDTYGLKPKVQVIYQDGTEYYISNNQSSVRLHGNPTDTIIVDHGGQATGVIKIE